MLTGSGSRPHSGGVFRRSLHPPGVISLSPAGAAGPVATVGGGRGDCPSAHIRGKKLSTRSRRALRRRTNIARWADGMAPAGRVRGCLAPASTRISGRRNSPSSFGGGHQASPRRHRRGPPARSSRNHWDDPGTPRAVGRCGSPSRIRRPPLLGPLGGSGRSCTAAGARPSGMAHRDTPDSADFRFRPLVPRSRRSR
jgi:hypothetical protein